MPNIKVVNMAGKEVGEMTLSDTVFGAEVKSAVLHAAVRAYLLNQRQGTQSTLTRAEVSGGGKKPWKQKGTGRARQGSTRSPQWTHGGVALGPKPRSYRVDLNKKVKRAALFGALSSKVADGKMIVVDEIAATEYKTKKSSCSTRCYESKEIIYLWSSTTMSCSEWYEHAKECTHSHYTLAAKVEYTGSLIEHLSYGSQKKGDRERNAH